jgi:hypothetical protein
MLRSRILFLAIFLTIIFIPTIAMSISSQKRLSNVLSSSTTLMSPLRLTKIGDIPDQIVAGTTYTYNVTAENLGTDNIDYQLHFVIGVSYYYYPMNVDSYYFNSTYYYNETIPDSSGEITSPSLATIYPIYPYPQLTPDMVVLTYKGETIQLHQDNSTIIPMNGNVIIYPYYPYQLSGNTKTYTANKDYYDNSVVTIKFTQDAPTDMSYSIQIYAQSP